MNYKLMAYLKNQNEPMILTSEQSEEFNLVTICHICKKTFEKGEEKVKDHDHITGNYRGAADNECNLNYNYKNIYIPVVFHNLEGYDSHLIMQSAGKVIEEINDKREAIYKELLKKNSDKNDKIKRPKKLVLIL